MVRPIRLDIGHHGGQSRQHSGMASATCAKNTCKAMRIELSDDELHLLREACVKRIDRSHQKIKHYANNPEAQKRQPGVIHAETVRIGKLHAVIAKIDLQLPTHKPKD